MSVDRAVRDTIAGQPGLVRAAAASVSKAWGALAACGIVAFREMTRRPPTESERRAIWTDLWRAVESAATEALRTCGHAIDPQRHATCEVCGGMLLCVECARAHYCTTECRARGCVAGLCVKEVRDGTVADTYGIR